MQSENPTGPDLFRGTLVRLAAPRSDDAEAQSRWSEDAEYRRLMDTDWARPETVESYAGRHSSSPNSAYFSLRTQDGDRYIGFVVLHNIEWNNATGVLAIGIGEREYWGKGYGSDALRLILRYGFQELNLHRIGLDVHSTNTRAIRAYEKAGFTHEGRLREAGYRDGERYDRLKMGVLRREWEALQG